MALLQNVRKTLYDYKQDLILNWGIKKGYIMPYDEELIAKMRKVYYAGVPASVILLSNCFSNGQCYDRALLMARVLMEEDADIRLVCALIDNIRNNPKYAGKPDPYDRAHCYIERVTSSGKHLIYDTSYGFIFDKRIYALLENPSILDVESKEEIRDYVHSLEYQAFEESEKEKYDPYIIVPKVEQNYDNYMETYAIIKSKILQRELDYFKKTIGYDDRKR